MAGRVNSACEIGDLTIRAALALYKRVRRTEFSELPKTISAKIRRVELRQTEVTTILAPKIQWWLTWGKFTKIDFGRMRARPGCQV